MLKYRVPHVVFVDIPPILNCYLYADLFQEFCSTIKSYYAYSSQANIASPLVYIKRGNSKNGRNIANEDKLIACLSSLGFIVADPGSMSVQEQYDIFSRADVVVGSHGSAFVNMLFMKPSSHVFELTSEAYVPVHDYLLSSVLNLSYHLLVSPSINSLPSSDFFIDIDLLLKTLKQIT